MNLGDVFPSVVPENFQPLWVTGLEQEAYHRDATSISSSGVRSFLRTPSHFFAEFILGEYEEPTDAMKFGTLAHKAILEPSSLKDSYLVIPDFGNCTYKENKANRDSWYAEHGLRWVPNHGPAWLSEGPHPILIKEDEAKNIEGMVAALLKHPRARKLLEEGSAEISGYFREPKSGLKTRIRPDFVNPSLRALIDYKTTRDASFRHFSKECYSLGYHVQLGMYDEGIFQIEKWRPEQVVIIAQEKVCPWAVAVYVVDEGFLGRGQSDFQRAALGIRECMEKGHWPGYSDDFQNLYLPPWADQDVVVL